MNNIDRQKPKTKNCFYICGLTGGPFFPIPAIQTQIQKHIPDANPILIGVRYSYESRIATEQKLAIEFLPKAKLDLLSFKNLSFIEIIQGLLKSIVSLGLLAYSFAKCLYLVTKYKPILIYSTGSFLAVPMLWATCVTNFFGLSKSKIIIHQQDATMGLANKLTDKLADLKSCVFAYTKTQYSQFANAELIPNPIITGRYNSANPWHDKQLEIFVKNKQSNKPLLLIFGGGSGALAINNWINENVKKLTNKFRVIHLTGILQNKESVNKDLIVGNNSPLEGEGIARFPCDVLSVGWQPKVDGVFQSVNSNQNPNYHTQTSVLQDMPVLLASVDLVICRAGLGSISELSLLNKPTFLVPLPNSHQLQNAELVTETNSNFKILDQNQMANWLETIINTKFKVNTNSFNKQSLDQYYDKLFRLLD